MTFQWFGLVWFSLVFNFVSFLCFILSTLENEKKIVTQDKETKIKTKMEKMDLLMNGLR